MSKYATLIARIVANIKRNGAQSITGDLLQEQLLAMITSLGEYYQFGGLVSSDTEFTAGDEPVVFIAATPGTYTNFGGLVVADGEVALLVWSGSAWSKQTTDIATRSEVSQLGQKLPAYYFMGKGSTLSLVDMSLIQGHEYLVVLPVVDWSRDETGTMEEQNIFIIQHLNDQNSTVVDVNVTRVERLYGAYKFVAQGSSYYQVGGRANTGIKVYFGLIDLTLHAYVKYTHDNFEHYVWYQGTNIGDEIVRIASQSPDYENSYSIKTEVRVGEKIIIYASGASNGRQWYFINSNNEILSLAQGNSVGWDIITAPENAKYIIVQTNNVNKCEIYRFNFNQNQLFDVLNEGGAIDKKYLSRPYIVNSPDRLPNCSIEQNGKIVEVQSQAWDIIYFPVFAGDTVNVKIDYNEIRYFSLGLFERIEVGSYSAELPVNMIQGRSINETYIATIEGYIGFSFNKVDGGTFAISINNKESGKEDVVNSDYRLIGITDELSGNINAQSQDAFYWGVGCRGTAKFGDTLIGASTTAIADMKPITYENGQVIIENGCIYLTCSTRNTYCGILIYKMDLGSYQMELVGNIIYKIGTEYYSHYVCSSMMYDRNTHLWIITMDTWEGDRQLYVGSSVADPRVGYHIIEVEPMDIDTRHGSYVEDQYILYDDDPNSPTYQKYVLVHTDADDGFSIWLEIADTWNGHYTRYSKTTNLISYTGCFTQKVGGRTYIITGTRMGGWWEDPSLDEYHVLSYPDLQYVGKLNFDKITGGYGGWGSLFAVPTQNGTRYVIVTFDRGLTSPFDNWTYGTTHIYESAEENPGYEYPLKMQDGYTRPADIVGTYTPLTLHFKKRYAKTFYLCDWLTIEGFWPNALVNRSASNEIELTDCTLTTFAGEKAVELFAATEGYANIGPYIQLGAFKTLLYNKNGAFMFIIANGDYSLYRKLIFTNTEGHVVISVESKLSSDAMETKSNQASFDYKTDLVEIIVGVCPDKFVIFVKDI